METFPVHRSRHGDAQPVQLQHCQQQPSRSVTSFISSSAQMSVSVGGPLCNASSEEQRKFAETATVLTSTGHCDIDTTRSSPAAVASVRTGHGSWTSAASAGTTLSRCGRLITAALRNGRATCTIPPPLTNTAATDSRCLNMPRHYQMSVTVNNHRTANLSACQRRAQRKVIASITRRPYTRRQTSSLIYTRSIANRRHSSTAIKKACLPTLV